MNEIFPTTPKIPSQASSYLNVELAEQLTLED